MTSKNKLEPGLHRIPPAEPWVNPATGNTIFPLGGWAMVLPVKRDDD